MKVENKAMAIEADATHASAAEPLNAENSERLSIKRAFGEGQGRKRVMQPKSEYKMQLPPDVEQYIRENGGSGFVVGLVRGVMPRSVILETT